MRRIRQIDLVKSLAIFLVLIIHTNVYMENLDYKIVYGALSRCAVPLFMMASGVLLYRKEQSITKSLKTALKLIVLIAVFNFVYRYWDGMKIEDTSFDTLVNLNEKFHLYYLYIAVVLFATAPAVSKMVLKLTRSEQRYVIILFFIGSILIPYLKSFKLITSPFILSYSLSISYSAIGYAIIGDYIYKYRREIPRYMSLFGVFTIGLMIYILMNSPTDENFTTYFEMVNPLSFIYAISVFLFVIKSKTDTDLSLVSNSTLLVYTTHVLLLEYFLELGLTPSAFKDFEVLYPIILSLVILVLELITYSIYTIIKKKIK